MRWRRILSFSYECVADVHSQLELIVCFHVPSHLQEGDTRFELIAKYLVTPIQEPSAQRSKDK